MEKLTQYLSIARFVKKAIDLSMTKERSAIDLSMPKERSAIDLSMPKERSTLSIHNTDRHFHIAKNSQKAIALFDLFQKGDRPSCQVDMVWDKLIEMLT